MILKDFFYLLYKHSDYIRKVYPYNELLSYEFLSLPLAMIWNYNIYTFVWWQFKACISNDVNKKHIGFPFRNQDQESRNHEKRLSRNFSSSGDNRIDFLSLRPLSLFFSFSENAYKKSIFPFFLPKNRFRFFHAFLFAYNKLSSFLIHFFKAIYHGKKKKSSSGSDLWRRLFFASSQSIAFGRFRRLFIVPNRFVSLQIRLSEMPILIRLTRYCLS